MNVLRGTFMPRWVWSCIQVVLRGSKFRFGNIDGVTDLFRRTSLVGSLKSFLNSP